MAQRRSAGFLLTLLIVLSACATAQQGGASADPGTDGGGADSPDSAPDGADAVEALTFSPEDDNSAVETVTLDDGGTVTATASDGTAFELVVPPQAVPEDTEITLTPLADVRGVGDGPVHAVLLEPDGQEFAAPVELTITPAEPIALSDQLMFEATATGEDAIPALVDPTTESIVLLLEHFSIGGVAGVPSSQQAAALERGASSAEKNVEGQLNDLIQDERERLQDGEEESESDRAETVAEAERILDEYERTVVQPRREAARSSCAATRSFVQSLIRLERARIFLLGEDSARYAAMMDEATSILVDSYDRCEEEAVEKCRAASRPAILVRYWIGYLRLAEFLPAPEAIARVPDAGSWSDEAREACTVVGYVIDGSIEGEFTQVPGASLSYTGVADEVDPDDPSIITGRGLIEGTLADCFATGQGDVRSMEVSLPATVQVAIVGDEMMATVLPDEGTAFFLTRSTLLLPLDGGVSEEVEQFEEGEQGLGCGSAGTTTTVFIVTPVADAPPP